jgi:hypothetical protein
VVWDWSKVSGNSNLEYLGIVKMSIKYVAYDPGGLISDGGAFWKPTICNMGTNECCQSAKVKKMTHIL